MPSSVFARTFAKGGGVVNLSDRYIGHYVRDPLVLPVTNFTSFPIITANYNHLSLKVHTQLDTFTFVNLSTFAPPHSQDYLDQICSLSL